LKHKGFSAKILREPDRRSGLLFFLTARTNLSSWAQEQVRGLSLLCAFIAPALRVSWQWNTKAIGSY